MHDGARNIAAALLTSTLLVGGSASAFQVPADFESQQIDIGACTGNATHYESSPGGGIGNAFALLGTHINFYYLNPHYDGGTGVPVTQTPA